MAREAPRLDDLEVRRRAATDFATNLIVRAGAGTGKTSLLIERALNAIGAGVVTLERLAAITFTEKAAGEMRERLAMGLDRLRELASSGDSTDLSREADRAWIHLTGEAGVESSAIARRALAAMEQLDAGTVATVHAFCAELLRSYPVEAGVDPDFSVDSGEQAIVLRAAAWEGFVSGELGPTGKTGARAEPWKRLLARAPLDLVERIAGPLSGFEAPPSELTPPFESISAREIFSPVARRLAEQIRDFLGRQGGATSRSVVFFEQVSVALDELADDGIDAFRRRFEREKVLSDVVLGGRRVRPNTKLQHVTPREFDALSRDAYRLSRALYESEEELGSQLLEIVAPFARQFRTEFLRRGFVSFDGLLVLTRDLLRDHPDVRNDTKRRWGQLLVDEFQDTDPLQYEIVLLLAERPDETTADPYRARLQQGKLFVVGDAKQSIYRFRNADYAAYRAAVQRIVDDGGVQLDLISNFRSVPEIVEPVNRIFASSWWDPSDYQPEYVPIHAAREATTGEPRVEVWTVDVPPGVRADERREAEGRLIADEIHRLHEAGLGSYRDFSILFRAFSSIEHYLRPLRQWGVPFVVDGGKEFLERPEVVQLMAILRALAQPEDPVAVLAYLRGPVGGVSDTQLADYADAGGFWHRRASVDATSFPAIAAALDRLARLADETRHLPADAVVRVVLERTRMLPLGAVAFEGAQRVANLRKLASAAGDLARDGKLSLEEVVEALREGRLEDIQTDRPLADDAADAVRITSIHRMKGLENAQVFLPDLAREAPRFPPTGEGASPVRLPDGRLTLAIRAGGIPNPAEVWREREHLEHGEAEEKRVFYVGVTRARERLVMLAGLPPRGTPSWIAALEAWGLDPKDRPDDGARIAQGDVIHRVPPIPRAPAIEIDLGLPRLDRAVERYERARACARDRARASVSFPSAAKRDEPGRSPKAPARQLGKAVGIVIHDWLEGWRPDDPGDGERFEALCLRVADELGVERGGLRDEVQVVRRSFLDSDLSARLGRVTILGRELPLLHRDADDHVWRGVIDLVYRDDQGDTVVADYKTDTDEDASRLGQRYGPQLRVYCQAAAAALDLSEIPAAELWLVRSGKRISV